MRTLAQHAVAVLPAAQWHSLGEHIQRCMFPPSHAVRRLQRLLLARRRARMAAFLELLKPQASPTLAPASTVPHLAASAYRVVQPGDHLVVMVGGWRTGFAHHGIAVGMGEDGTMRVADFSRPGQGLDVPGGNILRFRSLDSFVGKRQVFGIVPYPGGGEARAKAVARAEGLVRLQEMGQLGQLPCYDVLRWNCETFARLCVTGEWAPSEQAARLLDAITHDLRLGQRSVLLQAAELGSGLGMMIWKWLMGLWGLQSR